jgi:hypothetical protein
MPAGLAGVRRHRLLSRRQDDGRRGTGNAYGLGMNSLSYPLGYQELDYQEKQNSTSP